MKNRSTHENKCELLTSPCAGFRIITFCCLQNKYVKHTFQITLLKSNANVTKKKKEHTNVNVLSADHDETSAALAAGHVSLVGQEAVWMLLSNQAN